MTENSNTNVEPILEIIKIGSLENAISCGFTSASAHARNPNPCFYGIKVLNNKYKNKKLLTVGLALSNDTIEVNNQFPTRTSWIPDIHNNYSYSTNWILSNQNIELDNDGNGYTFIANMQTTISEKTNLSNSIYMDNTLPYHTSNGFIFLCLCNNGADILTSTKRARMATNVDLRDVDDTGGNSKVILSVESGHILVRNL
jgi:hypothetical protein